jgi:hypothetical protein
MHSRHDDLEQEVVRGDKKYESPAIIEYGNVIAITRNALGGGRVDGFGDPPDQDDPAYAST